MIRRLLPLIVLVAGLNAVPAAGEQPYVHYDLGVRMSDGVRLEVSVYFPNPLPAQPVPMIVRQHGGGSNKDNPYDVTYGLKAVATGRFGLIMYSHRGHGGSGGVFDFFGERTTKDFSEILDWADAKFDLADTDRVGAWGYSQGGAESLLPAMADDRVKAVAVGNTFDNLNHALNPNDCFKLSFATGIFALAYKQSAAITDDPTALRWGAQWYTDSEDVALPVVGSTTAQANAHSPDNHLMPAPGTIYDNGLNVPVFWSNSWEDALFPADHGLGILANLEARGIPTHLWFASGGHEVPETHKPDEEAKEAAMVQWFEEFLLGMDHGFESGVRPKVDYAQRIPGGGWTHKTASAWPIPGAGTYTIPLREHTIVNVPASANVATEPILSNRAAPLVSGVPDSFSGPSTATFSIYDPLAADLEATGAARVALEYSTTARRVAQFAVKVWDVAPGAGRRLVARGCLSDESPWDGRAEFDLWPGTHVFPAGHWIEVTVSTSDAPTFKPDTEPHATTILPSSTVTLTGVR